VFASPAAKASSDPRPIPYGTQFLGPGTELFHVEAPGYPGLGAPETANAATITDFNGALGLVYVGGHGVHTDKVTGIVTTGIYWEVDMRFMVGEYVGKDGQHHHGTFGFI
jgi:hypothetical protein